MPPSVNYETYHFGLCSSRTHIWQNLDSRLIKPSAFLIHTPGLLNIARQKSYSQEKFLVSNCSQAARALAVILYAPQCLLKAQVNKES